MRVRLREEAQEVARVLEGSLLVGRRQMGDAGLRRVRRLSRGLLGTSSAAGCDALTSRRWDEGDWRSAARQLRGPEARRGRSCEGLSETGKVRSALTIPFSAGVARRHREGLARQVLGHENGRVANDSNRFRELGLGAIKALAPVVDLGVEISIGRSPSLGVGSCMSTATTARSLAVRAEMLPRAEGHRN